MPQWESEDSVLGDSIMLALSSHAQIDMPPVRQTENTPEKHLLTAILRDAVKTIQDHADSKSRLKRSEAKKAMEWITTTEPQNDGISFETCCMALGYEPEWIRKQILSGTASSKRKHRGYR